MPTYYEKAVYIPSDLLEALGDAHDTWWSDPELVPVICDAIRAWIAPAPQTSSLQEASATGTGYQWKQLFLPDGTKLRATFGKETWYVVVQDGQLKYGEHFVSPSCFANLHGSGNRNAWKAIWLRFPGNEQWFLADTCRAKQKEAITRLFVGNAAAADLPSPTKAAQRRQPQAAPAPQAAAQPSAVPDEELVSPGALPAPLGDGPRSGGTLGRKGKSKRRSRRKWHAKKKGGGEPRSAATAAPQAAMPDSRG